ncbi:MAG: PAS domain-containing protein [Flavobacterium sp.]|nr:PAS domain-containing protein [Flavobacterium sp.]
MKSAYLYKSSLVIKIALATAVLLIAYITGLFFTQMQNIGSSFDAMSLSNKRLLKIQSIYSAVSLNESSLNSYIILKDSAYLQDRFVKQSMLDTDFVQLKALSKNKHDSLSCDKLRELVDRRYAMFDQIFSQADKKPDSLASMLHQADIVSDQIRELTSTLLEDEVSRVHKYEIAHKYDVDTSVITSFILVTIALFILLVSLNRINADLKSLKQLNDELQFVNHTFNNAEKVAGMSHWKYNLVTRKFSFSDNFFSLIGKGFDASKLGLKSIIARLHPDDRDHVRHLYQTSSKQRQPFSVIYRMMVGEDEIKYVKTLVSYTENSQGQMVEIGVNYDITDQHQTTVELQQNNRELRDINAELESFNNIVSHDLQEPLRKIQMFISRIDEREAENLSDAGRDYFSRIKISANRMQNLLIDLVNFSRTMKGEKNFELASLNDIAANVLTELGMNIEEKNAVVTVKKLPTALVIPFQMHQLFINLMTNSLKFVKAGSRPEITIKTGNIHPNEAVDGNLLKSSEWHKIVVSDNGIGFLPEFADKVFLLFRRLEKDADYSGTGIGLAICKKIVENHKGHIIAQGTPGKGATFTVYLPK